MSDSVLTSTKKNLGIEENYTAFDLEISTHINSVFTILNQLGIGPMEGFRIEDADATWTDFLGGDLNLDLVKTVMYLRVRLLFDPPSSIHHITALKEQLTEFEWRLNVAKEDMYRLRSSDSVSVSSSTTIMRFDVKVGLPFGRRICITNGKNLWANLEDFEARMHIRAEESSTSQLNYDFTQHLVKAFEVDDIIISWTLSGAQTRELKSGYFDLIVSDVGATDDRGIQILHGYLNLLQIITSAEGS